EHPAGVILRGIAAQIAPTLPPERDCHVGVMADARSIAEIPDPAYREAAAEILNRIPWQPGLQPYDYQQVGIAYAVLAGMRVIIGDAMGLGKGGTDSTKILTPTGWTTFGQVQVG